MSNIHSEQVEADGLHEPKGVAAATDGFIAQATSGTIAWVDPGTISGIFDLKGNYDASTNTPNLDSTPIAGIQKGDVYRVSVPGTFFTIDVQSGDHLIANQDTPTLESHWNILNSNIINTDDVPEGPTNLYYTEGRVTANVTVAANAVHAALTTGNPHSVTVNQLDTTATGANLTTLTNGSNADALHNHTFPSSGQPGTWTQEAKGPTVVANNTEVTLATISGVGNAEVLAVHIGTRTNDDYNIKNTSTALTPTNGTIAWCLQKTTTDGEYILKVRQRISPVASVTIDWVVNKNVIP